MGLALPFVAADPKLNGLAG